MDAQVVVAKYKEDISWVNDIPCPVAIYDKDARTGRPHWDHVRYIGLPNKPMGREAHSYLTHIVKNYNRLADVTYFLQGNPFDHYCWWPSIVQSNVFETTPLSNYLPKQIPAVCEHDTAFQWTSCPTGWPCWLGVRWAHDWWTDRWNLIFSKMPPLKGLVFSSGAQFAVPKRRILQRPIEFYKYLLWHVTRDEEESKVDAWLLECFWLYIFGDPYENGFPDRFLKWPAKIMA